MRDLFGPKAYSTRGRRDLVESDSPEHQRDLKRWVILPKLGIWAVVSFFIADSDVVADWLLYTTDVSSAEGALTKFGVVFAVLGTIMWFVHVTEGHVVDKAIRAVTRRCYMLWGICRAAVVSNTPLGYLEYLPLILQLTLSIVFEDLPQLATTFLVEDLIKSTAGVISVTTAAFLILAEVVDVIQKSKADVCLAMQLRMVDLKCVVMRELLDAQDEAEEVTNASAELVLALAQLSKGSLPGRSRRARLLLHKTTEYVEAVQRRFRQEELEIYGECTVWEVLRDPCHPRNIIWRELHTS